MRRRPRNAGAEHQADDRQRVGRLVDDRGEEDPPPRRPEPAPDGPVGPHGAGQRDAADQAVNCEPERRRPPGQGRPLRATPAGRREADQPRRMAAAVVVLVRVGRAGLGRVGRGLVVVEREEPLEEEQRQQPGGRPAERPGRADLDGLGHHVEERRAEHRPGREAQVELEPRVRQHRRQRQHPAEQAGRHDRDAEQGEHRTGPSGGGAHSKGEGRTRKAEGERHRAESSHGRVSSRSRSVLCLVLYAFLPAEFLSIAPTSQGDPRLAPCACRPGRKIIECADDAGRPRSNGDVTPCPS